LVTCLPQALSTISARGNDSSQNRSLDLSLPRLLSALLGHTAFLKLHLSASLE